MWFVKWTCQWWYCGCIIDEGTLQNYLILKTPVFEGLNQYGIFLISFVVEIGVKEISRPAAIFSWLLLSFQQTGDDVVIAT